MKNRAVCSTSSSLRHVAFASSRPCRRLSKGGTPHAKHRCAAIARAEKTLPDTIRATLPQKTVSAIIEGMGKCLMVSDLPLPNPKVGKVRDTYDLGDELLIVTTDRQSAFDRFLASVPFKGQVLNQISAWWFQESEFLVPNAYLAIPDPNVMIMRKCKVFPVEFVVRGYMTGSTETSLWTHYQKGEREYCGNKFPDGLVKNQVLRENVLTPTTKAIDRDIPISPKEIIEQGLMTKEHWEVASDAALAMFEFGQSEAAQRGLLLVDTKYEFGVDDKGTVRLVDEVHTPDSSRYWIAKTYVDRVLSGQEPENIDKEFLRLWFKANCNPYKDDVLPSAPPDLIGELAARYIYLFEKITGTKFAIPDLNVPVQERILSNIKKAGLRLE